MKILLGNESMKGGKFDNIATIETEKSTNRSIKPLIYTISIRRCFDILETFTPDTPQLTLQDLTTRVALPKTTIHRLLQSLLCMNYVTLDPVSKKYSLGPKLVSLGITVLLSMTIRNTALPYMEELSRQVRNTVNLGILDGTDIIYVERIEVDKILMTNFRIGSRLNPCLSSMGRAILAFLTPAHLQEVLTKLSRNPEAKKFIETKSGYFSRVLCEVRQKGYALVDEEFIRGVRGIAAPIFNFKGEIEAAINIPVFAGAISRKKLIKEFLPLLKDAAEKISIARGYTPQLSPGIGGAEESQVNSKPVRQNKK